MRHAGEDTSWDMQETHGCSLGEDKRPALTTHAKDRHDFRALQHLLKALTGPSALHPRLTRIFQGNARPEDDDLIDLLQGLEQTFHRENVVSVDGCVFTTRCEQVREHLWGPGSAPHGASAPTLWVSHQGRVEFPDGMQRQIKGPALRIVLSLAHARMRDPDTRLSVWDLFASGWPDEKPLAHSAINRVYVTMTRLRAQGFGPWLQRVEGGYRLAPHLQVELV